MATGLAQRVYDAAIKMGLSDAAARVAASQAVLETANGKKAPGNNYFGIKGKGQVLSTKEGVGGELVASSDSFKTYGSMEESLADWVGLMQRRYPGVLTAPDFETASQALVNGRYQYATDGREANDPLTYTDKLSNINFRLLGGRPTPPMGIPTDVLSGIHDRRETATTSASTPLPPSLSGHITPAIPSNLSNILANPLPAPAPLVAGMRGVPDPRMLGRNPSGPISGQTAAYIQRPSAPTNTSLPPGFDPRTLQTLSPPRITPPPSSYTPTRAAPRSTPEPVRTAGTAPYVSSYTPTRAAPRSAPPAPTTQTVANPAYTQWQKEMAAYTAAANNSSYIPYSGYGDPGGLTKPVPPPPAPPKTITVPVPTAPAANPIGDVFGWLGTQAGALGNSAVATINGVGAALPGAIDTAKANIVNGIMMSPEARSPFVNGAIGAIGQNGRQYLGDGMTSALRFNHDTGEFERYTRRIAVPTGKVPFEDYNARKIGGSKFTESISSMGGARPVSPEERAARQAARAAMGITK